MVFLILDSLETLCCPSHHASHADQSILTIITSSLYSAIGVPEHISVSFMEETTFTGTNTGDDGILIANYILRDNLSTRWNYNDLAFPKFAANIPLLDECLVRGNPSPRHESHHRLPSSNRGWTPTKHHQERHTQGQCTSWAVQPAPMERANLESSTRWNHRRFKHAMVGKAFGPVLNGKLPTDNISSGVGTVP